MSAPDTNLDKQKKRHWGPLVGMGAGIALAAVLIVAFLVFMADGPGEGEADRVASPDVTEGAAGADLDQGDDIRAIDSVTEE
jgi:hypothetical protein